MKAFSLLALFLLLPPIAEAKSPSADRVWVIIRPKQCLGNPWEKEWLAKHQNDGVKYPLKREDTVIKSFFVKKHIPILDVRLLRYVKGDPICQACDCPRGDTLYILINPEDVPKMVALGYAERMPADAVPPKKPKK